MGNVIIVGGGAAGMAAAISAAANGRRVDLFEKNEKLGKKLYITGKGRCNVTNDCGVEELLSHVVSNAKFLYSSFYRFDSGQMMSLLESCGCPLKTERGGRVFPVSDKSSDVIRALSGKLKELQVRVHLGEEVGEMLIEDGRCAGITLKKDGRQIRGTAVIIATGGLSYPVTGSTGDGYRFAAAAGHRIVETRPALAPMETREKVGESLQGLSLKNIEITVVKGKRALYREFGEMLFTHFGVSGPVILSASSFLGAELKKGPLTLFIDLKPALSAEQLDARLVREFGEQPNRQFKNTLAGLFPAKLIPEMVRRCAVEPEKRSRDITKEERLRLVKETKGFCLTLTGLRGYREAVITQGGVSVREVDPSTMESKKTPGLYFAGEVLDLDALTGGYNLQIAWSTAWAAGRQAGT